MDNESRLIVQPGSVSRDGIVEPSSLLDLFDFVGESVSGYDDAEICGRVVKQYSAKHALNPALESAIQLAGLAEYIEAPANA